ncbi:MAG: F0F1 ATP synthase subunit A [Planctomycetales bacterium]|nr:F0F1 ATP synthase subunit A [Planctomycetales bacterium]
MANPVLHIKDSYYFEVPKVLYPSNSHSLKDFPAVWISLDPEFQDWEFDRLYDALKTVRDDGHELILPPKELYRDSWHKWVESDHANHGKPFDVFVEEVMESHVAAWQAWQKARIEKAVAAKDSRNADLAKSVDFRTFIANPAGLGVDLAHRELTPVIRWLHESKVHSAREFGPDQWDQIKIEAGDVSAYKAELQAGHVKEWSQEKLDGYNYHLSGKILIPQPFGARLRNLYEREPGLTNVAVSKFMIVEVVVGILLIAVFSWLGRKVAHGAAPKGKVWNLLESMVVFIKDEVAEPAVGHHDAHAYIPYLWTIFFFVLGCNLMGMVPWVGAPTGAFGVTLGLAILTLGTVVAGSMARFGFFGFFKNLVPHMDLPLVLAIFIKPGLFLIELAGLLIKHGVLAVRLLANMVAGHLVLLGIMGVAFTAEAVAEFAGNNTTWSIAAVISILGCTLFSMMELFVAFLQAYIFTFLSALFIGAALHEH